VASTGYVPTGDGNVDEELQRIDERRRRLRELHFLDEEEARLRGRVGAGMPAELSPDPVERPLVEAESR
jgi:RNA 3'-terminal phosphate cyclase